MDNGFSILMLIFGAAVMLYAAILSSGNHKLLPLTVQPSLRSKDKKGQTKHIAAVTAVTAVPIILGGLAGAFWGNIACLITMAVSAAVIITAAVIRHKHRADRDTADERDPEENDDPIR
ncbi:hypothetical protein SAMN02910353_01015 [Ruminococcus sp. YRD2003]|uniref:hypothetical protein n=1 Tax=Ruminococcus sp. YRD2003 TaxID=1452313 RepID=UPI0008ACE931|nr:hypothetical protein SAMN02910353_01015 [Ruminococcus flavefaciens]